MQRGDLSRRVPEPVDLRKGRGKLCCDVVHEGAYFGLTLARQGEPVQWLTPSKAGSLIPTISIPDVRQIVLEGSVPAAVNLLPAGSPCPQPGALGPS